MFERFTRDARAVVTCAVAEADVLGAAAVAPEHLMLGVVVGCPDDASARVLVAAGLDAPAMREALERELIDALAPLGIPADAVEAVGPAVPTGRRLRFSPAAKTALAQALKAAVERGDRRIEARHVALGVLRTPAPGVQRMLDTAGVERDAVWRALSMLD
jgi:ATP-dependent Clp protease ATP-binding subunit ClpA